MRINFDFQDLEVFLAVIDTGTFHLASEKLGLSQSSVTRRIQKLEQALDVQLFVRTTREVRPTLAGKRLRGRAEIILNETIETAQALLDESTTFSYQRASTIRIAALPTLIPSIVAPAVAAFRKTHPDTRFRILDVSANEVAEAIAQGEADLGISSAPAYDPTTQFEQLFVDEMMVAMPAGHPLSKVEKLTWREVSIEPMVLPAQGTGNRMLIDEALARAGVPRVWTLEVSRTSTALELVRYGVAFAPVPSSALANLDGATVSAVSLVSPTVSRSIGFVTRTGSELNARLQDFQELVRRSHGER